MVDETLTGEIFSIIPFYFKIKILAEGDTCVQLGVKGLKHIQTFRSNIQSIVCRILSQVNIRFLFICLLFGLIWPSNFFYREAVEFFEHDVFAIIIKNFLSIIYLKNSLSLFRPTFLLKAKLKLESVYSNLLKVSYFFH